MKASRHGTSRQRGVGHWAGLMAGVVAVLATATPTGQADEASGALAKYDKRVDASIDRALKYLAKVQLKDGSFPTAQKTAVTSLAVMAFLSKGYTPGGGPYGKGIDKAIDYVLAKQQPNGLLVAGRSARGPMYHHGISTLMLSEVSGMVSAERQKKIDKVLPKALKLILTA